MKTKAQNKNLRHSSLDTNVCYMHPKFQTTNYKIGRDMDDQK